jgi:UDP-3-O-[3-hydroxymyristoyl] glucosamine N-acyltransferase
VIGAGAAIGPEVRIGRQCGVGPGATILHALIGDRVAIRSGVRVGDAGPSSLPESDQNPKIPQTRRVIIQDGVEIGANTTIDRGSIRDTVIGEGTAIGSLVRIAHDVGIGRYCRIAAQAGLGGGVTAGDFVIIGGQACVAAGVTIDEGAVIARHSRVNAEAARRTRAQSTGAKSRGAKPSVKSKATSRGPSARMRTGHE